MNLKQQIEALKITNIHPQTEKGILWNSLIDDILALLDEASKKFDDEIDKSPSKVITYRKGKIESVVDTTDKGVMTKDVAKRLKNEIYGEGV